MQRCSAPRPSSTLDATPPAAPSQACFGSSNKNKIRNHNEGKKRNEKGKHFSLGPLIFFIHEKMAHHGEKPEQSLEDMEAELSQPRGTLCSYIAF
jgi:hypothetical protein